MSLEWTPGSLQIGHSAVEGHVGMTVADVGMDLTVAQAIDVAQGLMQIVGEIVGSQTPLPILAESDR